ncbi:hypothetical protein SCAR479_09027 [Seiridium cardinale]|uniref:Uncharacterized protein n=1 Tax=Seiridium cardinale TaxID=138064 RepID=A0ABR2XL28_9PEZI
MKFSAATLFLATITYVSAAAVFIRDKQRAYDNETHNLKDRGLWRRYADTEPNYSKINGAVRVEMQRRQLSENMRAAAPASWCGWLRLHAG